MVPLGRSPRRLPLDAQDNCFQLHQYPKHLLNWDISVPWNYAQTGVHLFFVLSGFLLFLPYARAMLQDRPLPTARRFYQRRALRILPAYWVCMIALVLSPHWS